MEMGWSDTRIPVILVEPVPIRHGEGVAIPDGKDDEIDHVGHVGHVWRFRVMKVVWPNMREAKE